MSPSRFALLLSLALVLASPAALAQGPPGGVPPGAAAMMGQVTGTVTDAETGQPLPSATVALYRDGEFVTGTAASADGAFAVGQLRPGSYEVRVSSVGYETLRQAEVAVRPGAPVALGTLRLAPSVAQIGEAEITGERELIETRADRTVYNVSEQPVTTGGSAIEVLQTLPAVEVDLDGNIALRGNQNVAIHINGRPVPIRGAQLAAFLRQLPSGQVDRVEVLPNPSARYEADAMGGIINIVLKQGVNRGLAGGITVGGGSAPNAELSGNVSYQAGRVDAYASYGFRYDDFNLAGGSFRSNLFADPSFAFLDQTVGSGRTNRSHVLNTTLDYILRPGLNLNAQGLLSARTGTAENATTYRFLDDSEDELMPRRYERIAETETGGLNGNLTVGLKRAWTPQRHELNVEARYSANRSEDEDLFTETGASPRFQRNDLTNRTDDAVFQADYVRPLSEGRVEVGARAGLRRIENDLVGQILDGPNGTPSPDPGRTNAFDYAEDVYAAYLQGSQKVGSVEFQGGVRAEHTATDFSLATTGDTFARTYTDLFPSVFASYTPWLGGTLRAGYSRRINRPRAQQLNPFTSFDDPLNVRVGNPGLRPEYVDAFEVTASQFLPFGTVSLAPFYRRTANVIRPRFLFDPETGVSTFTQQNLDVDDSYGADLTLAARFGQRFGGFLSTSVYRTVTSAGSIESGLGTDGMAWTLRGNIQAQLRQGLALQGFGFYRSPLEALDGRISSFAITSIGLRQQFMSDRAALSLRVNDVLNTTRFEFTSSNPSFRQSGFRDPQLRRVDVTFTYNFGQASQQRRRRGEQQPQVPQDDFGF
jgi:outer membrane receptor protein involved in Fe transport